MSAQQGSIAVHDGWTGTDSMKRLLSTLALGAGVLIASTAAFAAPSGSMDQGSAKPDMTRLQAQQRADNLFEMFDVNHDGVVTRTEAQQVGQQLLAQRASSGKDSAPGIGGHTLKFLEHAFAGAQTVTRQQFEQAMLAHFDSMDLNHDGLLTAAERDQGRAQHSHAKPTAGQ